MMPVLPQHHRGVGVSRGWKAVDWIGRGQGMESSRIFPRFTLHMKQKVPLSLLATLLFAAACSSVSSGPRVKIIEPNIGIRQVVGPAELGYPQGPIEVEYEFEIKNNSAEPLTLRKVHVQTVNPAGGAYSLRPY